MSDRLIFEFLGWSSAKAFSSSLPLFTNKRLKNEFTKEMPLSQKMVTIPTSVSFWLVWSHGFLTLPLLSAIPSIMIWFSMEFKKQMNVHKNQTLKLYFSKATNHSNVLWAWNGKHFGKLTPLPPPPQPQCLNFILLCQICTEALTFLYLMWFWSRLIWNPYPRPNPNPNPNPKANKEAFSFSYFSDMKFALTFLKFIFLLAFVINFQCHPPLYRKIISKLISLSLPPWPVLSSPAALSMYYIPMSRANEFSAVFLSSHCDRFRIKLFCRWLQERRMKISKWRFLRRSYYIFILTAINPWLPPARPAPSRFFPSETWISLENM